MRRKQEFDNKIEGRISGACWNFRPSIGKKMKSEVIGQVISLMERGNSV